MFERVILLGQVLPPLTIVDDADIEILELPAIVNPLCIVQLPPIVRTALWVIVPVYPAVIISDKQVLVLLIVESEVPKAPLPLNITSSVEAGATALLAPPSVSLQGVGPVAFQLLAAAETPTQYFVAILL